MLLERVAVVAVVVALAALTVYLWRCCMRRRLALLAEASAPEAVRKLVAGESPAILYFTTAQCAQCRFQQSPILEQLAERARVAVYAIDAVAQQDLARFYGVMTVPSTVVLHPEAAAGGGESWACHAGAIDAPACGSTLLTRSRCDRRNAHRSADMAWAHVAAVTALPLSVDGDGRIMAACLSLHANDCSRTFRLPRNR